jgi:hypothetical protein
MLRRIFYRRQYDVQGLFSDHFIEVKAFYILHFDRIPCVSFIGELDITPAFAFLRQNLEQQTTNILQHSYYDYTEAKMFFNNSIFVLTDNRMLEVSGNYCQVLHTAHQYEWAVKLVKELAQFRIQPLAADVPATVIGFARQTTLN